ncbi:MAG: amino acid ABC transporter permease [Brevundimonas sp.]|uniref:amino acid ABC transporter permease n=1 Tax=Brevundimonas sp. TaxID=1871086 RepID=UPI00391DBF4D
MGARDNIRAWTGGWPGLIAQTLLLGAFVALIAWLASNAATNMAARGLSSGFDFLGREAGFDISQSLIDYSPTDTHARVFLVGALNTLQVAALGILTATFLGLIAGVMRLSRNWLARIISSTYVEVARNTPLPIQILLWYSLMLVAPPPRDALGAGGLLWLSNRGLYLPRPEWNDAGGTALMLAAAALVIGLVLSSILRRRRREMGARVSPLWGWAAAGVGVTAAMLLTGNPTGFDLPQAEGFGFTGGIWFSPPLVALWAALSFYTGGFIAEVVRGGLQSVPPGQSEAAQSVGLDERRTLSLVVLPQAMRVIVPPLASQYLNLAKNSSLAVIIGYPDLVAVFAGTSLNQTGQAIETLAMVMAFYLALSLSISAFMNWWNARTSRWANPR